MPEKILGALYWTKVLHIFSPPWWVAKPRNEQFLTFSFLIDVLVSAFLTKMHVSCYTVSRVIKSYHSCTHISNFEKSGFQGSEAP